MSAIDSRIASETGHAMRKATLYACILKLERLGLIGVQDMLRAPSGGRPERVLALTDRGRLALEVGEAMARHMLADG